MKLSSLSLVKYALAAVLTLLFGTAYSQYPATGNKQRLGWQTTGDGLVYRGAIADTSTLDPSGLNNAWMLLDTVNGSLYAYRSKAWQLVSGGGGVSMPFDSVTFNINEGDASEQELKYSAEKGYLQYGGLDSVQIPLLPGIWYVRNDDSVTVSKGMVVRASGTLGASGRIKVKRMIADGSIPAMYVLGIAMHDIASGADGYVMTQGKIRQVNTTAYSEGAVLYADVDTLGGLTQTEPGNGFLKLPIAFVVHSASNGTLAVRIDAGSSLRDLHDVDTTGKVDGSVLRYDSTAGYWKASTTAGIVAGDTAAMLTNYINVADTATMLSSYISNADTATMLSSYISNADTSVFARDFQISGTTNRLAMFTGSNTVGNSIVTQNGRSMYINSTQDNSEYSFSNAFQFNGFGSGAFDQPVLGIIGNVGTNSNHRPYLSMYRSAGSTVDDKTLVPYNYHLGSITWQGADGTDFQPRGAEITAITDSITGSNDMPTALFFGTTANGAGQPTERMRITSAGRVGIGTPTPSEALDVNGVGRFRQSGGSGGGPIEISDRKSTFNQNINWNVYYDGSNWKYRNSDFGASIGFNNSGDLLFANIASGTAGNNVTAFRERLRINENGNVGIGTASPSRPLHVNANTSMIIPSGATGTRPASGANGDIRYNTTNANFEWYSGTGWREAVNAARSPAAGLANRFSKFDANGLLDTSAVLTQSNGRIGIGVAPTEALQVNGKIKMLEDLLIYDSVRIGRGALNTITSNVAIGYRSLDSINAARLTNNIGIGSSALRNVRDTAATGSWGSSNIAIGASSMAFTRTGYNNTAIGVAANLRCTNCIENVAIGGFALTNNIRGAANMAIGNGSMLANIAGGFNVAIGPSALAGLTSGQSNVGFGGDAGRYVGASGTTPLDSATSSIFIGRNTRAQATSQTNQIVIGHQSVGNGSNTTTLGNSSTTATYIPAGKMYIGGTTAPTATLHVNGSLSRNAPVTVTANYTVTETVSWIVCDGTATIALTLPAAASWTGREIMVKTIQPYTVTSASANVVPIDGVAATNAILPATDGAWATLVSDGTNWIIMQQK